MSKLNKHTISKYVNLINEMVKNRAGRNVSERLEAADTVTWEDQQPCPVGRLAKRDSCSIRETS